jgi:hypothetical protein
MKIFNLKSFILKEAQTKKRRRIKDRGINWKEIYAGRSAPLKKRFERDIGEGSYRRWEGHDYTTNGDYFIVVGPARMKSGDKMFFSGIKKLPPIHKRKKVYAPSGKYFNSILSALSHAGQKWGVPFPQNQANYTSSNLANVEIPRHIKASITSELKTGA